MSDHEQAGAQAPDSSPMSLEDRVSTLFGDDPRTPPETQPTDQAETPDVAASEEAAPDVEAPEPTAPEFEEVEYDGERFQVPVKLKTPLIQGLDYTKKTQEVAEQRRIVEFEQRKLQSATSERKFAESVKPELDTLAAIDQRLAQYRNINIADLADRDISLMRFQVDQLKEQREETQRLLDGRFRDFQAHQQKAMDDLLREGREIVRKNIPNFNEAVAKDIAATLRGVGYSDEQIATSLDPSLFKLAYEASQFRKLQSQKAQTSAKVSQVKPLGKTTPTNPMPSSVKDQLNYRKALSRAGPPGSQARQNLAKDRVASIFGK